MSGSAVSGSAQPLDLVTNVGLGIEPGPRHPCCCGDGCKGSWRVGTVEFAQCLDSLGARQLMAPGRCFGEVPAGSRRISSLCCAETLRTV
jgi:hypothetical protein